MKRDAVNRLIKFVLKYIWVICALLIVLECSSTVYISSKLMQETSQGVLQSVCGDISGRVDGVLRLLTGLSKDERFNNTEKPLYDRIILAEPYRESYNLFMIALTDAEINVVSSDEKEQPDTPTRLAHRDYMQRLYNTGVYQITDAFPAGSDGVTMNYTIAVPILQDEEVAGAVFGSIFFEDLEDILDRNSEGANRNFYLLGSNNTFMAGGKDFYGKSLFEAAKDDRIFGTTIEKVDADYRAGKETGFWIWEKEGLCYMTSMRVEPTNWTLVYQISFASVLSTLIPVFLLKAGFYVLLCIGISLFGRRYLRKQLDTISHLLDKVAEMQKEIFQSEQMDYDAILEMTQRGLTDQLTGLATRGVMLSRVQQFIGKEGAYGGVFFTDLDDLKLLNDLFGHEAGDCALVHFGRVLKEWEQKHDGVSSRYGGDEFILLINGVDENGIVELAEELCSVLRTDIHLNGESIPIHGSIGVCCYPKHGSSIEELIAKADLALYEAKRNGKNTWSCYEERK